MDAYYSSKRVALDPLDLNFLPLTCKRDFSKINPLWSTSSWGKNDEYFEFEIRNKSEDKSSDDISTIVNETITCSICDIDVPKLFIKDHYKSKKHAIYKQIADTALERMKNNLNRFEESASEADPNIYFCAECVAVVKVTDKQSHNRLQSHKNSVMVEKLLADFMHLYTNNNDDQVKINEPKSQTTFLHDKSLIYVNGEFIYDTNTSNDNSNYLNESNSLHNSESRNCIASFLKDCYDNKTQIDNEIVSPNKTVNDTTAKKKQRHRNRKLKKCAIQSNDDLMMNDEAIDDMIITNLHLNCKTELINDLQSSDEAETINDFKKMQSKNDLSNVKLESSIDDFDKIIKLSYDLQSNDKEPLSNDLNTNDKEALSNDLQSNDKKPLSNDSQSNDEYELSNDLESNYRNELSNALQANENEELGNNLQIDDKKEIINDLRLNDKDELNNNLQSTDNNDLSNNLKLIDSLTLPASNNDCLDAGTETNVGNNLSCGISGNINNDDNMEELKFTIDNFKIDHIDGKLIFEKHNAILKTSENSHKIRIVNEKYLEIETLDGAKLCVPSGNYFYASGSSDGLLYCEVCATHVKNKKLDQHLNMEKHMSWLSIPIKDQNCLRMIAEDLFHCVLCNEIKDDSEDHIHTKHHQMQLKRALVKQSDIKIDTTHPKKDELREVVYGKKIEITADQNEPETSEFEENYVQNIIDTIDIRSETISLIVDKEYFCDACKTDVHINDIKSHVTGSRHKMNKISDVHYMMKEEDGQLVCKVCQKHVPNDASSLTDHINSSSHVHIYKNTLYENWIEKDYCKLLCRVCDEGVFEKNELIHISAKRHSKLRNEFELKIKDVETQIPYYCAVCDVYIPNTDSNIKAHGNNAGHKIETDLKPSDAVKNDVNENLIRKSSDADVQKSSNANQNILESETTSNAVTNEDTSNVIKEVTIPHYCTVCEVNVPNNINNIEAHNNGAAHKKKLEKKGITPANLNVTSYAAVANINKQVNNIYYCTFCDVNVTNNPKNIEEHKRGAVHRTHIEAKKTVKKNGIIKCKVCKVYIPNSDRFIAKHRTDAFHLEEYRRILVADKIYQTADNRYYCIPCRDHIDSPLNHTDDASHKGKLKVLDAKLKSLDNKVLKLQQLLSDYNALLETNVSGVVRANNIPFLKNTNNDKELFCDICSTKVPNNEYNLTTHMNGSRHKTNYSNMEKVIELWQVQIREKLKQPQLIEEVLKELLEFLELEC